MNAITEWLKEENRPIAWLARKVGMLRQTLSNKIRGLSDEQITHTLSAAEWAEIMHVTGIPCPICTKRKTEED